MENRNQEYPLVSIGVPTFNRNKGICRTLDSIWMQKYPNLEVIVSDNCSQDNTQEVVQSIRESHPELLYYRQALNIGMISNFEFVRKKSTGKYFMWVADDDELEPGVLMKYITFLESNPEYALVSGKIKYTLSDKPDLHEHGFTFEQKQSGLRVLAYYSKVVYGGMIHGLMRRNLANQVSLRKVIGNDYHFIANIAYLGEIKNLGFVGYHKSFGGTSRNFKQYAFQIGDSKFAGNFPHIKMASDAFAEVMYRSPVYAHMRLHSKFALATSSFAGMLFRYYGFIFPFMLGGRIKRFLSAHHFPVH